MPPVDHAPAEPDEAGSPVAVEQPHHEPETDEVTDDAGIDEPAGTSARRVPPLLWVLVAGLVLIALVTSLLAADATADRNRERQDRKEVEEVAGRLATALSTYDYRDFEATKRRVLGLSTGAFASEYERAVAALTSLIDQTKATSEATASDVFVGGIEQGKASAIVVLEIRAAGIGGPRVSVDNYVDLSLVKVEGEWRVDGVRNLNLGVAGGGAAAAPPLQPAAPAAPPSSAP